MRDVNRLTAFTTILLLSTACAPEMDAQLPTGSIIRFEIENSTLYQYDGPMRSSAQIQTGLTTPSPFRVLRRLSPLATSSP